MRLFPRRQLQIATERRRLLVHREPRLHGRHFEQHAAGLTEIDRREIGAIADVGDANSRGEQVPLQLHLLLSRVNRHGDVMNRAEPVDAGVGREIFHHVDVVAGRIGACHHAGALAGL
jgi:hypothetical protein